MKLKELKKEQGLLSVEEAPNIQNGLKYYRIARIQMKMSYYAWAKGVTVKQLIVEQIIKSYVKLRSEVARLFDCNKFLREKRIIDMLKAIMFHGNDGIQNTDAIEVTHEFRRTQTMQSNNN